MNFVIPTYFKAIDQMTGPIKAMKASAGNFAEDMETRNARLERSWRKFSDGFMKVGKIAAVGAAAILTPLAMTISKAAEMETALASFRTIVSDLNDIEFSAYRKEIERVANSTNRSMIDVTASFESIAGLNADFAKTADGLAKVSEASIVLSKASRMELQPAAESLVGIMNQFNLAADQADRTINVLAAGQAVGAANISQTAEAFVNFGSVASGANITLEQSVGLIQTLGKFSVFGAEAGTKLRGSVLKLQQAGVGYKSGQFQINDALAEAKKKIDALKSSKAKDAMLTKMFGAENISTGRILLENIEIYKQYTEGVTGTSEAQKAAAINSNTMAERIAALKNTLGNMAVTIGETLLPAVSSLVDYIAPVIKGVAAWMKEHPGLTKAIVITTGVIGVLLSALSLMAVAVWAVNTALYANPIIWIVIAIGVLIAAIAIAIYKFDTWGKYILALLGPIGWLVAVIVKLVRWIKHVSETTTGWGKQWNATLDWMKSIFKSFYLGLQLGWQVIVHSFWNMIEAVVKAWKWGQNKMGLLSDEQYAKDMKRIEDERKARVAAIKDTAMQVAQEAQKVLQGPGWHIRAKTEMEMQQQKWADEDTAYPARVNAKAVQSDTLDRINNFFTKQQELTVKVVADQGTTAQVVDSKNIKPQTSTTTGVFANQGTGR